MIIYKKADEIEIIKEGSLILSKLLGEVSDIIKPGITTLSIDKVVGDYIRDFGARPSFNGYHGYKFNSCISVNDQVVHGLPSNYVLKEEDICSVDCGVFYKNYHSDSAFTFCMDNVDKNVCNFVKITKKSLNLALSEIHLHATTGDIGHLIQDYIESNGYSVVRDLVGHGIGKNLHEDPEFPNFGFKGKGPKIKNGMVFAIEPMTTMGHYKLSYDSDGWTLRTFDKSLSAHFEHTIAFIKDKPHALTTFDYINKKFSFY